MYNYELKKGEELVLISDNTKVYTKDNVLLCTSIITNLRLIILDYPSGLYNSEEDLRTSGRWNYVRQKEIIFETNLSNILNIKKEKDYYKITFKNKEYILIKDEEIIKCLNSKDTKMF